MSMRSNRYTDCSFCKVSYGTCQEIAARTKRFCCSDCVHDGLRFGGAESDPVPTRSSVLSEADALVNGDRAKDYGDASESFGRLAKLWSAQLGVEVSAAQVAQCLALLKLSRLAQTPSHRDSWVDLAGYASLGAEVSE